VPMRQGGQLVVFCHERRDEGLLIAAAQHSEFLLL
jgi:hypothetical protein